MTPVERLLAWVFTVIDRAIFSKDDLSLLRDRIGEIDHTIDFTSNSDNRNSIKIIYELLDAIDTKTSALLTHISIIIAGLLVIKSEYNSGWIYFVIRAEIVVYMVLTLSCLRAIRMIAPDIHSASEIDRIKIEYWKRRQYYNYSSSFAFVATIILIVSLTVKSFFGS